MIIIPEKVVYIKVPKAASTTIARMFWDRYDVDQAAIMNGEVASNVRHFVSLDQVGSKVPVLNGNWFFNRSGAFGWHAGYQDLIHVFGEQLRGYHWVASVRHPVPRMFSVFSFQVAKGRINASLTEGDFASFCQAIFEGRLGLTQQQHVHTWAQSRWLPAPSDEQELSLIRQENLAADVAALAARVPSFAGVQLAHANRSFQGDWERYVGPALRTQIEDHYTEDMERFGY
jgi:hypothetical protein